MADQTQFAEDRLTPEQELAKAKHLLSRAVLLIGGHGRGFAQELLAEVCDLIDADPFEYTEYPDVLVLRRPDLERRRHER